MIDLFYCLFFQPRHILRVSKPRVPSSTASKHTLKRRSQQSEKYLEVISGQCSEKQRAADIKRMTKEKKHNVLNQAGIKTKESYITADKQLAMQMDLNLTENQMRGIRRWGNQENVKFRVKPLFGEINANISENTYSVNQKSLNSERRKRLT